MINLLAKILDSIEKLPKIRKALSDTNSIIKLLELECETNVSILNCLNFSKIESDDKSELIAVTRALKNDILTLIFSYNIDGNSTWNCLSNVKIETDGSKRGDEDHLNVDGYTKLFRLYKKLESAKAIAELLHDGIGYNQGCMKKIKLRDRLSNIRIDYITICAALNQ